jgi:GT2 family glycosyltransferase
MMTAESSIASPRISVILSVWNDGRYLRECIDSVLAQEFPDFELLVEDDASTDNSYEILSSYSDPRIKLTRNSTRKYYVNVVNSLAARSRGALLKPLCGDDVLLPDCLSRGLACFDHNPDAGYILSPFIIIDSASQVTHTPGKNVLPPVLTGPDADLKFLREGCFATTSALFVPKVVWVELGGYRDITKYNPDQFPACQDFDFVTRVGRNRYAYVVQAPLVKVRMHQGQLTRAPSAKALQIEADLRVMERIARRTPASTANSQPSSSLLVVRHGVIFMRHAIRCALAGQFRQSARIFQIVTPVIARNLFVFGKDKLGSKGAVSGSPIA